jgi:hypothetical protein
MKSLVVVSCILALASCAGSSDSDRQRNATLTNPTGAPTITKVVPQDGALTVYVTLSGDEPANTWFYQLSSDDPAALNPLSNGTANTSGAPENFTISGLTNGATYTVRVANWNGEVSPYASATSVVGVTAARTNPTGAPTITKVVPQDGALEVYVTLSGDEPANTWFYQLSSDDPAALNPLSNGTANTSGAPENFTISGLTNGATYTVRVANWNGEVSPYASATSVVGANTAPSGSGLSASPTTTTSLVPACASGGVCVVGDTGPGGGIVFYDAGSTKTWGRYLEYAPTDSAETAFGCLGSTNDASATDIGSGKSNSSEISLNPCGTGSAASVASSLSSGGKSDWYLPSKSELNELCKFAHNQQTGDIAVPCNSNGDLRSGFSETFYWSSTEVSNELSWYQNFVTGYQYSYGKPAVAAVRAVRAFNNADGATVDIAPVAVKCKRGGACQVGEIGPGGGVVFYAAATPETWGQYLEITTNPIIPYRNEWGCNRFNVNGTSTVFGSGLGNTALLAAKGCTSAVAANDFVGANNTSDWFLPSDDELSYAVAAGKLPTQAWTSSVAGTCDDIGGTIYCWTYVRGGSNGNNRSSIGRTSSSTHTYAIRAFKITKAS